MQSLASPLLWILKNYQTLRLRAQKYATSLPLKTAVRNNLLIVVNPFKGDVYVFQFSHIV
jgi:hypothetical protein